MFVDFVVWGATRYALSVKMYDITLVFGDITNNYIDSVHAIVI